LIRRLTERHYAMSGAGAGGRRSAPAARIAGALIRRILLPSLILPGTIETRTHAANGLPVIAPSNAGVIPIDHIIHIQLQIHQLRLRLDAYTVDKLPRITGFQRGTPTVAVQLAHLFLPSDIGVAAMPGRKVPSPRSY